MKRAAYLSGVPSGPLQLVIVGKDPYPRSAVEIPFCKESLDKLYAHNCSGGVVLSSLGYSKTNAQKLFGGNSLSLFFALRESGVVFLNAIYRDPDSLCGSSEIGSKIRKSQDIEALWDAYRENKGILLRAKNVILCGEARKIARWLPEVPLHAEGGCLDYAVHPDVRNRYAVARRHEWEAWWAPEALRIRFDLNLPGFSDDASSVR